ncbi:MAG TPA: right-handed parallel beta-helix repeat-containing protein [Thermoanaerobaculia bacterium]|nr:right-handed parallel beta-helix repeat-containing protein [Thermoanaerobaculia bacterium]
MRRLTLALLLAATSLLADDAPVTLRAIPPLAMAAGNVATWRFVLVNRSPLRQTQVPFEVSVGGLTLVAMPPSCTFAAFTVRCSVDLAPSSESPELAVTIGYDRNAPPFGRYVLTGRIATAPFRVETAFAHDILVTTVADSGPGSLRDAIAQVNAKCGGLGEFGTQPCRISFAIDGPLPAAGWFTIAPRTALAPIVAYDVLVDGGAQSRHTGDTNPSGPELMLDGHAVTGANGLELRGDRSEVTDLAIGFFPQNGIEVLPAPPRRFASYTIARDYLGVDPSGIAAAPNGWRGLQAAYGFGTITDSILSANGRAGAFLLRSGSTTIRNNVFGAGADRVTPLGNRASGLLIDVPLPEGYKSLPVPYRVVVSDNVVAYNAQAGIALSFESELEIGRNRILLNAGPAIDFGLNGSGGSRSSPPTIRSARYADGATTIEGTALRPARVFLYANGLLKADGTAEAEEFLGEVPATGGNSSVLGIFTLTVPRDLRGLYINASSTLFTVGQPPIGCICDVPEQHQLSSELSAPVRVE